MTVRNWSLVGHCILVVAHLANAIGALATLWGRPVFAMATIVLAALQAAVTTAQAGSAPHDP